MQVIQNFACRIILGLKKFNYILRRLKSQGWLNVCDKLFLNDVVMLEQIQLKGYRYDQDLVT